jgi:MoaA/NifB/PqqE/SkfB family radical SAM enzyme
MLITCQYSHREDGTVELIRDRDKEPIKLTLQGPEAELWLAVAELANYPEEVQRSVLSQPPLSTDEDKAVGRRLLEAITTFARMGLLRLEGEFVLSPWTNIREIPPLRKMHMELTHRCNLACRACYLGSHLKRAGQTAVEGDTGAWLNLIQEASELGCRYATVTGGEPFLRPDTLAILSGLSEANISAEINTNGTCITPRVASQLSGLLIHSVEVSLYGGSDGNAELYTSTGRSYSRCVRGIRALAEADVPFSVKYFATGTSVEDYERAESELSKLGVKPRVVGRFIHGDIYAGDPSVAEEVSVLTEVSLVTQATDLPCYPSVNELSIEPDGTVRACPKLGVHFGNVFEEGLAEVWCRSPQLNSFRLFWPTVTRARGFTAGAQKKHLCPATEILSERGGLRNFRDQWQNFEVTTR